MHQSHPFGSTAEQENILWEFFQMVFLQYFSLDKVKSTNWPELRLSNWQQFFFYQLSATTCIISLHNCRGCRRSSHQHSKLTKVTQKGLQNSHVPVKCVKTHTDTQKALSSFKQNQSTQELVAKLVASTGTKFWHKLKNNFAATNLHECSLNFSVSRSTLGETSPT